MKNINHLKILRHTDGFLVNLKYNCRLRTVELKLSKILLPASNYFYYKAWCMCMCLQEGNTKKSYQCFIAAKLQKPEIDLGRNDHP